MNTLLWRATWGYFLKHMMAAVDSHAPLLNADTIAWIRAHFINHVRADGPLPTVRVGRQPHGVLPVTSLAAWPAGDRTERLATLLRSLRDRLFRPAAAGCLRLTPGQPGSRSRGRRSARAAGARVALHRQKPARRAISPHADRPDALAAVAAGQRSGAAALRHAAPRSWKTRSTGGRSPDRARRSAQLP